MNEQLHLITVQDESSGELVATGATLWARVEGQSFFTGNEAFKKAVEVSNLVAELKHVGLNDEQIDLVRVVTEVESGLLSKSSSATYHLSISCNTIENLGQVVSAISSQKNAKLGWIAWKYDGLERTIRSLLADAVERSKASAHVVSESLGVALLGVHSLSHQTEGIDSQPVPQSVGGVAMHARSKMKAATSIDKLDLSHKTKITVKVKAEYIVSLFDQNGT